MYNLYLLASITTFYYLYSRIKRLLTIKNHTFEDLTLNNSSTEFGFLDITYEDYTREFVEDIVDFQFILHKDKPIKYATINYSIDSKHHSILFNNEHLTKLAVLKFPFYDNIVKMPLYREVKKALIFIKLRKIIKA